MFENESEKTRPDPKWIGLAVLALPCVLYSMDLTVLNLAVPALSADLRPSASQLLWIIDIYGFLVAGSLITMGTLGDRIGRGDALCDDLGHHVVQDSLRLDGVEVRAGLGRP